ncbi:MULTISPECIES: aromatic amino acid transport family protein [unclassified Francisella]|uniref:aromatic amino acid transport family protein n=1 Tax=unclassified Francisella TaxID=2610885 RepID=UPI002E3721A8|nr:MULTISPECIES: aromatic amino acid transport family protein [unclassified Francisella]MED7818321.1 aromatic amino acid transport family protein [Francisella sp. 19S2-4]MED7829157.1 aromatic amino acid transport family protein [Francisella sp. 19S2-10]
MNSRSIGSIFLIIGTTTGVGMLSLPLVVAACGFTTAIILLILSWSIMYIAAIKLLNTCAEHPIGANFTSIMYSKVPKPYLIFFTLIYLLFFYSMLSSYISQGSSLLYSIDGVNNLNESQVGISSIIFILIFGALIFSYKASDYTNRILVILKFIFFIIAVVIMLFYINTNYLSDAPSGTSAIIYAFPTILPAFVFHSVIPFVYEYQEGDVKRIKKDILISSVIVLIIYIIWIFASLGVVPQHNTYSFHSLFLSNNYTPSGLIQEINAISKSNTLEVALNLFIHIAIITSFIGVSISLAHYIRDLFNKYNKHLSNLILVLICFIPPLMFTVLCPAEFILVLQYASIFTVIIFIYTPMFLSTKTDLKVYFSHTYMVSMGSVIILFEIFNLFYETNPFMGL